MSASMAALVERRDETRVSGHSTGTMEAPKAIFPQAGTVVIEEVSGSGLRLRSDAHLHPDEELVIHLGNDPMPVHATVVWVKEVPRGRFRTTRSWIAGCRLAPDSMTRIHLGAEIVGTPAFDRKVLWMIGAMLGTAALVAYLLLRFAALLTRGAMP